MKRYSQQGLWSLFLISAFPLHLWTLILALRDFSWVSVRTNSWDAIGVISYGLLFALIESIFVFLVVVLLGFLISKKWEENRRNTLLGMLVLLTSLWAMGGYLFFLMQISVSGKIILYFAGLDHPLRLLYAIGLIVVGLTISLPVYFILHSDKFMQAVQGLFERLSLLTLFYLFFDVVGIVIIVFRNIP